MRLRWRYELLPNRNGFSVRLGVGLSFMDTSIEVLTPVPPDERARGDSTRETPQIHLHASYAFLRTWRVYAETDGFLIGSDEYSLDATAGISWRFHPQWDLSFGIRLYAVGIDRSDLQNQLQLNRLYFGLAYSW